MEIKNEEQAIEVLEKEFEINVVKCKYHLKDEYNEINCYFNTLKELLNYVNELKENQ